ncbi:RNA ligase family protein [Haliea sp.]|uniref:RNA ligase family protein n=1 Tax=Haliea sp. TaxID=1932666 RepID=UPI0025BD4B0B|nr:RNA ligase family protein [Haliea sp.]|tara:strand:+ start:99 stop:1058 length:960 start_codon:yes stop_codon:yes gene_type:complete
MFVKFGKIEQFRNVVKQVRDYCSYHNKPLPTIDFNGTVKLHGTNAAVGVDEYGNLFCQSRSRVITPDDDNFGFANFVMDNKHYFESLLGFLCYREDVDSCILYGEWCGSNIQKGVALSELDKMFVVFDGKGFRGGDEFKLNVNLIDLDNQYNVYNINEFPTYNVTVDFNNPEDIVNTLTSITERVEKECPVGKHFNVSGVGEGVVWTSDFKGNDLRFKVKGEKHSVSKVKKLVSVDPEVVESVKNFVDYAVTENRLEQGLQEVGLDQNKIGMFIGWVNKDINKEEKDVLDKNGLTMKQVGGKVSDKARNFYLNKLNNFK